MELKIVSRDEDGSEFTAKFTAQGIFECEISGLFRHAYDSPSESTWEVDNLQSFGKVNGLSDYPIDEILSLLGNGCMDIGVDLLDEMLAPFLDQDRVAWSDWLEQQFEESEKEQRRNEAHFQKLAGF